MKNTINATEGDKIQTTVHKADTRGHANHGWLESHHSFSFAGYYNPDRTNFGLLRVLNDDVVAGGKGFGKHPHDNMEIISIPLEGELEHEDSMGTKRVISKNDVQVMSAGTGVLHSEYNKHADRDVKFLQIWIFPKFRNIAPRYDQKTYDPALRLNNIQRIVSPMEDSADTVKINQDAYLSMSRIEPGRVLTYSFQNRENGAYVFILSGSGLVAGQHLSKRDAIGIWNTEQFEMEASEEMELLIIETPLNQ
jgi:redox-sensitive bicupin YhaK (pirin superfamily)